VDEIRLSAGARYTAEFTPARRFTRDDETVQLFHCDKFLGPWLPSDTSDAAYGKLTGTPALAPP
jgi:hypothetical protein